MNRTITIPAGTRIRCVATGRSETLRRAITVEANHRIDDDTWVWTTGGVVFEVKLAPGD